MVVLLMLVLVMLVTAAVVVLSEIDTSFSSDWQRARAASSSSRTILRDELCPPVPAQRAYGASAAVSSTHGLRFHLPLAASASSLSAVATRAVFSLKNFVRCSLAI